ncbi:MAG: hypothetical protein KatS3mg105_2680 [Gemmatales bacterium]|nr:MAG: hypothetical protein KatS3mg105_2680 [Gemmatales bacterium]
MVINLILVGFWFFVGLAMLIVWKDELVIRGTGINAGWLMLFLAFYNAVRAWSQWSVARDRELMEEQSLRRQRGRYSTLKPQDEIDPNFVFEDQPQGDNGQEGEKRS